MNSTPETRYTLIEKIKNAQDVDAWLEFAAIYQPVILKICRGKGIQHADATDITQEVLTRVAAAIENFDHKQPGASFRGWLYRITRNLMVDFFRKREKNPLEDIDRRIQLQYEAEPSREESIEFQLEFRRQLFVVVARTVQSQVKPETWSAFWQTEIERRSVEEVSGALDMTAGAIYVARSRVIARLRKEVQARLNETAEYFV